MSIGVDYSMGCPAACVFPHSTHAGPQFWFASARKYPLLNDVLAHRLITMEMIPRAQSTALALINWLKPRYVQQSIVIEDYAFSATGRQFHIGEHAGILKLHLYQARMAYTCVPPTVIKKFATGKGNADKQKMTAAFLEAYAPARAWIPAFFPKTAPTADMAKSPLADLADAYWIASYAKTLTV